MDPRKWMAGGPDPEPGDLDEEIASGRLIVEYLEPNSVRMRVISDAEAERIRLKPAEDPQA